MAHSSSLPSPATDFFRGRHARDEESDDDRSFNGTDTTGSFADEPPSDAELSDTEPFGGGRTSYSKGKNCMLLFQDKNSGELRVCGCKAGKPCHRKTPRPHKDVEYSEETHAPDGMYVSMTSTHAGSPILDGMRSSFQSYDEYRASRAVRTGENLNLAGRLARESPGAGRDFRNEELTDLGQTPVRDNLSPPEAEGSEPVPGSAVGPTRTARLPRPPASGPRRPPVAANGPADEVSKLTQLLEKSIANQLAFQETVMKSMKEAARTPSVLTPDKDSSDDDSDDESVVTTKAAKASARSKKLKKDKKALAHAKKLKSSRETRGAARKGGSKAGKDSKAAPGWWGVVAVFEGTTRPSRSSAKKAAKGYAPQGRVSPKFETKKEARKWVSNNICEPPDSDTESDSEDTDDSEDSGDTEVEDQPTKSRMVPPGRLKRGGQATESVTQDPSVGKKNELFGMELKQERKTIQHLAPKGASDEGMRALVEAMADGTSLPGTYSEFGGGREGGDDSTSNQLAETLSRVLTESQQRGIVGSSQVLDTGYKNPNRVSLTKVTSPEKLHALDKDLGRAIPSAIENMKVAFGSALDPMQWTVEEENTYFLGGHLPFIAITIMRNYADLVRELARRTHDGWPRCRVDIKFFVDKLLGIRKNSTSRFIVLIRTYCFLRDQHAQGFHSVDRQSSQIDELFSLMNGSPNGADAADKPTQCSRCKQKGLHRFGKTSCPFKDLEDHRARQAGVFAMEKVAGGMSKTKAYEAGIAEFT
jgi:hypothetical protein